jgi:hypothetical protein
VVITIWEEVEVEVDNTVYFTAQAQQFAELHIACTYLFMAKLLGTRHSGAVCSLAQISLAFLC